MDTLTLPTCNSLLLASPDCAVCASGYTAGISHTCYACDGATAAAAKAAAITLMLISALVLLSAYKYLTSAGTSDVPEQSSLHACLSRIKQAFPLQAVKILIVAWQIITEVCHDTFATFHHWI